MEQRIARLEAELKALRSEISAMQSQQYQGAPQGGMPPQQYQGTPQGGYPPQQYQYTPKPKQSFETLLARVWLPTVFIIVLLVGVLWGFVAIVKEGYLSESVRCLLGVFLAIVLYVLGLSQYRNKRPALGKVLLGGSHGLLVITISVAHLAYEILSLPLAICCYVLAFGQIIYSSIRWKSETLVSISIVSGFVCAFLVDLADVNGPLFIIWQLVFSVLMLLLCYKLMYRVAYCFAFVLLHFSLFLAYNQFLSGSEGYYITAIMLQLACLLVHFIIEKKYAGYQMKLQGIAIVNAIGWMYILLEKNYQIWYWILLSALLICYVGIAVFFNRRIQATAAEERESYHNRLELILIAVSLISILLLIDLFNYANSIAIAIIILIGSLVIALRKKYLIYGILSVLFLVSYTFNVLVAEVQHLLSFEMLNWLVILGSFPIIYHQSKKYIMESKATSNAVFLPILIWIYAFIGFLFVSMLASLFSRELEIDMQHYFTSAMWLLYAVGAIVLGVWKRWATPRITGIFILFVVLLKVIFVDLPDVHIGIKAVIFIVLGGVGILISRFIYNSPTEKNTD